MERNAVLRNPSMAARLWRGVLGCELLIALMTALISTAMFGWNFVGAVALAAGVLISIQFSLAIATFVTARVLAHREWHFSDVKYLLRALLTEIMEFGSAQVSMSLAPCLRSRALCAPPGVHRVRPVLLIHGILCNSGIWRALEHRLRAAGFGPISVVDLEPLGSDIDAFSASVERKVRWMQNESQGAPVAIVAHSMGGLVARALLRALPHDVLSSIVTVGTPHHGTAMARWLPLPAARQMSPASRWLQALNSAQEGQLPVPVTTIYSLEDDFVAPPRSAALRGAETRELRGLGHFGLLRSSHVLDCIVSALARP